MKNFSLIFVIVYTVIALSYVHVNGQNHNVISITVDPEQEIGPLKRSELFNNNSLLRVPNEKIVQKYIEEIGINEIMRCWLTIDDYWNPETGAYNFDFPCGWDLNESDSYYGYLDRFSRMSDEILLNVRGYHREVVEGEISFENWRQACKAGILHYKRLYPKIRYIEALNEYEIGMFGGLSNDDYYLFYKEFYNIVNEINQELDPTVKLEVGGPCITIGSMIDGKKKENLEAFLKSYRDDQAPDKRLSFLSYHEYSLAKKPSLLLEYEKTINELLQKYNVDKDIRIFVNEIGDNTSIHRKILPVESQLIQASVMATYMYYLNKTENMQGFHWVIQHKNQDRKNQIFDNLRWSPYGISLKMFSELLTTQIAAEVSPIPDQKTDRGIYCIASKGNEDLSILIWNYQWDDFDQNNLSPKIIIRNFEKMDKDSKKIDFFLLDSKNNNIITHYPLLTAKSEYLEEQLQVYGGSEALIEYDAENNITITAPSLESNSFCLIKISKKQ